MAYILSRILGQLGSPVPSDQPADVDCTRLEDRILFSATPLVEAFMAPDAGVPVETTSAEGFLEMSQVSSEPIDAPPALWIDDGDALPGGVFGMLDEVDFSGEWGDFVEVPHSGDLELAEGTIALSFTADDVWGRHTLFSKDFTGNRDGGDLTASVRDGRLEVRFQSAEESVWLKSAEGSIQQGQEYHFAFTFGDDGAWLYLDGEMTDWEVEFTQTLEQNTQNMAIGANTWGRTADYPHKTWEHFDGRISDFTIFDAQYDHNTIATLAGNPPDPPLQDPTVIDGVLYGTDKDETLDAAAHGVTQVQAGYGDDTVIGTDGDDVLDGGHGEDRLEGGDGDDLLISRSDGREPVIAQNYGADDDPDNEIDPNTLTYYSDQPIIADDVLIGGGGADTFRFEVLINAKPDKILDHVMDNGMIHWHGVAGENDEVHDHWVDRLGNEVIWDFNRAEGDKIEVVGHTVDVHKLEHIDFDGDGVLDASVLHVQSNQGNNGGAHDKDQLGTITVFGDLVMKSDYTVDAAPAYGIIDHVRDLDEAIAPRYGTPVADGDAPPPAPPIDDGELPEGGVFGMLNEVDFSGEWGDFVEAPHSSDLELAEGTIALSFTADDVWGRHTLFSKDFTGNRDGGDLTASVRDGRLEVRFQSAEESVWLKSAEGSIQQGQEYHFAFTFGDDGAWLYLDGEMTDWEVEFTQTLEQNTQNMAIGANTWGRTADYPHKTWEHFDGRISDFTIFDAQYDHNTIATLAGNPPDPPLQDPTVIDGVLYGTDKDETLDAAAHGVTQVQAGYGDDTVIGTDGDDVLDGGHGEDRLEGGDGDDLLISRSDGREPVIAQNYGADDDPDNEIDPNTLTYYSDQPIIADDVLIGGGGADTFRFEVLINAKPDKILDHVMDNGMIHWHGVAGENDEVHDHWVDRLGNEVIWDFNRAEGDKIEVVGHTVDVHKLEHIDFDGDGVLDASVLHVQSNQGNNGGAHDKDQLGTITVFGDLVMKSDYTVDAAPAYGIIDHVRDLDEAIAPRYGTPVADGDAPPPAPPIDDGELPEGGVFGMLNEVDFSGEWGDFVEAPHSSDLELAEGTIALSFTADDIWGRHTLFSKDFTGNRDGGDLTASVRDGRLEVRFQSAEESVWLKSAEGSIQQGQEYHFAMTFGDDGAWLYLDGEMTDWEVEFTQTLEQNTQNLVIGANTWGRTADYPHKTYEHFNGRISDFTIYDSQYDHNDVAVLAGNPPDPPLQDPTVIDGVLYGTDKDETLDAAAHGVTQVHAGYGDDTVIGTDRDDVLDGGHGEDRLEGGDGDDLLISRSDGREPVIAQNYGADDDPDNEIDPNTLTYYSDQPIIADDVLIGGGGADTFRFEVLINAKPDKILDHVMDNGMIHWHGVAGENDEVHDHWVDRLGNDVIWDFNRAEGDKIEVVGHTVDVYKLEHIDFDGDGVLDASVLHVQSNQGNNGGAHDKDQLGTITVFGDLVMKSDYTVDAAPAYGIIDHVRDIDEAIAPRYGTPVADGDAPPPAPPIDDGELPEGGVFGMLNEVDFSGEWGDFVEAPHSSDLELAEGTIALSFTADDIWGRHTLFSKDFTGNRDGGDLTASVRDGRLEVRFQSAEESVWLKSAEGSIQQGQEYHFAFTFGDDGAWLYLDGEMTDWEVEFTQTLEQNTQNMAIGANTWGRTADYPHKTWEHFDGRISDFTIFDAQYDHNTIATLAGNPPDPPLQDPTVIDGVLYGTDKDETLDAAAHGVTQVQAGYGDDTVIGTDGDDVLDGGHGEDRLEGGDGDDLLISRSDGREPVIAQNYGADDDPDNEIDPNTLTYYSDQPIIADDVLIGGGGADTFRFEVLINAKPDKILDHVMDNGMIHWHGVAGENDEVHDHWVDRLGNEVIWDFNRAEGDKIEVVGHTVDVHKLEHIDFDGDGVLDASVLHVQSNQGNNGGAHDKDQLGTITVFGDLVMKSDYTVDAAPAYGIIDHVRDLDEAIAPRYGTPVADGDAPPPAPPIDDGELPEGGVFGMLNEVDFSGEWGDFVEAPHSSDLELAEGTIALSFTADDVWGRHTLFSKDFTGNRDGGDLTASVRDGRLEVRFQSAEESVWLKSAEGSIQQGQEYHFAMTFGDDGAWLYLDGQMVDWEVDFTQGLDDNTQNMAIGANTWGRTADYPHKTWEHFDGRISDFTIYDSQYDHDEVATLAGVSQSPALAELVLT